MLLRENGGETGDRNEFVLHRGLAALNRHRLLPGMGPFETDFAWEVAMRRAEADFLVRERAAIQKDLPTEVLAALGAGYSASEPDSPALDAFVAWFERLRERGPGQGDPLFPWLAERATCEEMRWFLAQEVAGEAGFDDLVALTQVRLPARAKLELARNYWDEMGRGRSAGMHGPMLGALAAEIGADAEDPAGALPEARALGNLMVGLAVNRAYAFHSIGCLGAVELTRAGSGAGRPPRIAAARRFPGGPAILSPAFDARRPALARMERGSAAAVARRAAGMRARDRGRRVDAVARGRALLCGLPPSFRARLIIR